MIPLREVLDDAAIKEIVQGLRDEDFLFSCSACAAIWDVYRFRWRGREMTLALRMDSDPPVVVLRLFAGIPVTPEAACLSLEEAVWFRKDQP